MKILIIEDEQLLADSIAEVLRRKGFEAEAVYDGETGAEYAELGVYDLLILDVMMPGLSGYEVTRALRRFSEMPILILSAKSEDNDKILGLNLGADDYVTKPFNPVEVVARVKAQLRRAARAGGEVLRGGELALDLAGMRLEKAGRPVPLTPMEAKILAILMRSPGRVFTKAQLYEGAAGDYFEGDENAMMVHISKLRDKIEDDPRSPRYIRTIRGLGYRFEA